MALSLPIDEWIHYPWDAELFKLDINAHEEPLRLGTTRSTARCAWVRAPDGGCSILGWDHNCGSCSCIVAKTLMQDGVVEFVLMFDIDST